MKKLTILDENFISSECSAVRLIEDTSSLINSISTPVREISCADSEEIRFCPEYIQIKSEINPVGSVNDIINKCVNAIGEKYIAFTLENSARLSLIYNKLFSIDVHNISASDEIMTIFGGSENVNYSLEIKDCSPVKVVLTDAAINNLRKKLSDIRVLASNSLSALNNAVNLNDIAETKNILLKTFLMKHFIKYL